MVALAEKAPLLGSLFDRKECRKQFVTPLSCFTQSRCNNNFLAFQTSVFLRLLLDLHTYWSVDPLCVFPLFVQKVSDIIAPILIIIFRKLFRLGSFLEWWRSANETVISKSVPSPDSLTGKTSDPNQ